MHYLSPDRPRLGNDGLPLILNSPTRTVLPGLHLSPRGTSESWVMEVSVFLPMPGGGCTRREITFNTIDGFGSFWCEWLSDPESVMERFFNWVPGKAPAPNNIADLGDILDEIL